MTSHDDLPRDDWLSTALREAPDADAAPPATLRAAILREAAAKARPAPSTTVPAWRRAWRALGRPQWAAGFASVMVMVVAGVLWWDRPLDEALPPRAPRVTLPPPLAFNESASNELRRAEAPAVTASPATAPPRALAKARPTAPRQPIAQAVLPPAPPAPTTSPPPSAAPAIASVATPPPEPPPPAAPAATPEPAAPRARVLADEPPSTAKRDAQADSAAGLASSLSSGLLERRALAPAPARTPAAHSPFSLKIDNLRSEIAQTPGWTWQRDDAEPRPTNAALADWLGRLAIALRGARPDSSVAVDAPTGTLRLQRDGRTRYTFRLDANGISWLRQDGGVPSLEHFTLPAAEREALADGLKQLAP